MKILNPNGIEKVLESIRDDLEFIRIHDPEKKAEKMQAVAHYLKKTRRCIFRECQVRESFETPEELRQPSVN